MVHRILLCELGHSRCSLLGESGWRDCYRFAADSGSRSFRSGMGAGKGHTLKELLKAGTIRLPKDFVW